MEEPGLIGLASVKQQLQVIAPCSCPACLQHLPCCCMETCVHFMSQSHAHPAMPGFVASSAPLS